MNREQPPSPKADFSLLCYSLATQAMAALGQAPEPGSDEPVKNLTQAKHFIDLLEMLKAKTEGNLTEDETKILSSLLFDLRMRYVEESRTK